ncbi:hypothetical protein BC830DRAFT_658432 [Chytriomyces sp. MP71]|nr:hypothetical protein BC830DRAFT_658432 [Chytriomyces sp. MP71]
MKAVDDLSKRASLLPTKDLLHRLNTVMADIQEFDLLDRDVGLVVAEDTDYFEIDRIVHTSLNDGSDFDEGEPRDENSTFSMVESENGHGGHDHATRDPDSGRHPAHLVKHLNRMSLYTASYVPSEGGFPYEDDATPGGIDLLAFDGRQSISVGGPAIPITGKFPIAPAVELVKPELNSFEGSTLANSTEAFPSRASSHAFLPLTITVSNNAPANLLNLESYNSLPRRATSPLVPSSQTPRALSPTSTIPRFSSSNFPSLKPSLPFSRHPTFPTLMNPPHSRSVSSPTPHHHTMSTLSAPVMSSGNRGIGATKASLLNSEDDLDAISGQVKLHTNRLFRAWQDTILVLSPRKRGLYYVKTGGGLTSRKRDGQRLQRKTHFSCLPSA